jgi:hypothetical protein
VAPVLRVAARPARVVRVLDDVGRPIANARVELSRNADPTVTRTDSLGHAAFAPDSLDVPGELLALSIRRLGFFPWSDSIVFDEDGPLVVRLGSVTAKLEEVVVRASINGTGRLVAVDNRIRRGVPSAAVTREAFDKRNPVVLSQMLRGIAGVRVADSSGATVVISTRGQKSVSLRMVPCVMRVFVDGQLMPVTFGIDDVRPVDVHAVELYYGAARMPPEFVHARVDGWCGLVSIWTREGKRG